MKVLLREILAAIHVAEVQDAERIVALLNEEEHAALVRWSDANLGNLAGMYVGGILDMVEIRRDDPALAEQLDGEEVLP